MLFLALYGKYLALVDIMEESSVSLWIILIIMLTPIFLAVAITILTANAQLCRVTDKEKKITLVLSVILPLITAAGAVIAYLLR